VRAGFRVTRNSVAFGFDSRQSGGMNEDGYFDAAVAPTYDAACGDMNSEAVLQPTVAFLAGLAGNGRALEFAIGTGRVALPLLAAGVEVHGIEMSQAMLAELAKKPGAQRITTTVGDMSSTRVEGSFSLVYLVYNTITNLLTQDGQVACFKNAAAHLEPGGYFVIEVFIPSLRKLPTGESFIPFDITKRHLGIDEYDVVNQTLTSHHYWITDGRAELFHSPHRYGWPAEYDLMARIAGLTLDQRWANWNRDPFTAESTSHISVWRKPLD
jgi:SAM-dependent methyltransferase